MEVNIHGYSREDLMKMDIAALRAILHERTHHTIEVLIYRILKGKLKKPPNFGNQAKDTSRYMEEERTADRYA